MFAIRLDVVDETLIEEAWVRGSRVVMDRVLVRAIGKEATLDIKGRIRVKLADLADVRLDWTDWKITCDAVKCTDVLGAEPTDHVGLALLRLALKEETGGLVVDIDSNMVYVTTSPSSETIRIVKEAIDRLRR